MLFSLPMCGWSLPTVGAVPRTHNQKVDGNNPSKWIGKKFILLEQTKSYQQYGYDSLRIHQEDYVEPSERNSDIEDSNGSLLYDKFVGDTLYSHGR